MSALKTLTSIRAQIQGSFQAFFKQSSSAGIVILVFTAIAIFWTNSALHESYEQFLHQPIDITLFSLHLAFTFEHFVNDGLMVLFFLLVGLEIKREALIGELSTLRKAALPLIAALAGIVFPGSIYALFNAGTPAAHGWGVPVATDIAFALGVLALLGNRVPLGLKVFVAALAIADDLLAVLVIALFYTSSLNMLALFGAAVTMILLVVMNRSGVRDLRMYALAGVVLWLFVLHSGIHATIAGVMLAMTIPVRSRISMKDFVHDAKTYLGGLVRTVENGEEEGKQLDVVHALEQRCEDVQSPLHRMEASLYNGVNFLIMPVFALVNAGVFFDPRVLDSIGDHVSMGIILGLFLGKQIGITLAVALSLRLGIAELPNRVNMRLIYGVSILCGIGFTMALFVAHLAFEPGMHLDVARLSILIASSISALVGLLVLHLWLPKKQPA